MAPRTNTTHYRREIDGLRALAVISVMMFHAGFETFSGGFIGVDVFFVISGYLMTSIIFADYQQGRFSIVNFYERRARRILPSLFLVITSCIPLALASLLPFDMKDFSQSVVALVFFASNILFWHESGYFNTASEFKPLLHTWSLSVELQFYLLVPLFAVLFCKFGKPYMFTLCGAMFVASLALAQWAAYAQPTMGYYFLLTRIWEFLIGAFAAFYIVKADGRDFGRVTSEVSGWLGVALILFAIISYDKATPFPGLYALVPALGAALIILFGTQYTSVGKVIGSRFFVAVGLISYSTYLWHYPLFTFAKHNGLSPSSIEVFLLLSTVSFLLAWLSWHFVETPFRRGSVVSRKNFLIYIAVCQAIFSLFGLYGHMKNGDFGQISVEKKLFLSYFENELPAWNYFTKQGILEKFRDDCNFYDLALHRAGNRTEIPRESISNTCYTKQQRDSKVVFIWGDSHAQQLYYGLSKTLPDAFEVLQVASSGCGASTKAIQSRTNYCQHSNWFAFETIKKLKPFTVIVGQNLGHEFRNLENLARDLKSVGVQRVIITGPSPHWIPSLPIVLTRMLPNFPTRTFLGVDKGVLDLDRRLKDSSGQSNFFDYVSLIDFFCNKDGCLTYYDAQDVAASITSWDYGHLTPVASYFFAKGSLAPIILDKN